MLLFVFVYVFHVHAASIANPAASQTIINSASTISTIAFDPDTSRLLVAEYNGIVGGLKYYDGTYNTLGGFVPTTTVITDVQFAEITGLAKKVGTNQIYVADRWVVRLFDPTVPSIAAVAGATLTAGASSSRSWVDVNLTTSNALFMNPIGGVHYNSARSVLMVAATSDDTVFANVGTDIDTGFQSVVGGAQISSNAPGQHSFLAFTGECSCKKPRFIIQGPASTSYFVATDYAFGKLTTIGTGLSSVMDSLWDIILGGDSSSCTGTNLEMGAIGGIVYWSKYTRLYIASCGKITYFTPTNTATAQSSRTTFVTLAGVVGMALDSVRSTLYVANSTTVIAYQLECNDNNCLTCSNLTFCTTCALNYFAVAGTCMVCSSSRCSAGQGYLSASCSGLNSGCTDCTANTYDDGTRTCQNCQANSSSAVGASACVCNPGFTSMGTFGTNLVCTACSASACAAGAGYTAAVCSGGTTNGCSACAANMYDDGTRTCQSCPQDSSSAGGVTTCTCSATFTSNGTSGSSLVCTGCSSSLCVSGQGYNAGACSGATTGCSACAVNTYDDGTRTCRACPSDSHSSGGVTTCTCNAGFTSLGTSGTTLVCTSCTSSACSAGQGYNAGTCSGGTANGCTACTANMYDDGTRTCQSCPQDSSSAGAVTTCTCSATFTSNGTSGSSLICIGCSSSLCVSGQGYNVGDCGGTATGCSACAVNTADDGTRTCRACPSDSHSSGGGTICTCNSGFTSLGTSGTTLVCTGCSSSACSQGQGYNATVCSGGSTNGCSGCGINTYDDGTRTCQSCPPNSSSAGSVSTCICDATFTSNGTSGSTLVCTGCSSSLCAPGRGYNATACDGTAIGCSACAVNTYDDGTRICRACPSDSHSSGGGTTCTCNAGFTSLGTSGTTLVCTGCTSSACSQGQGYNMTECSDGGITSGCSACAVNTYDDGTRTCRVCPSDSHSSGGATTCTCNSGFTSLGTSGTTLVCTGCSSSACSPGEGYNATKCAEGITSGCSACGAETYDNGSRSCVSCPQDSHSSGNVITCTCNSGFTSLGTSGSTLACTGCTSSACSAGQGYNLGTCSGGTVNGCTACGVNTYDDGSRTCRNCPPDSSSAGGVTTCTCDATFTSNGTSGSNLVCSGCSASLCSVGEGFDAAVCAVGTATGCSACGSNSFDDGTRRCTPCPPGSHSAGGVTTCTCDATKTSLGTSGTTLVCTGCDVAVCTIGQGYNASECSGGTTTGCSACAANSYDDGTRYCVPCASNSHSSIGSTACVCDVEYTSLGTAGSTLNCTACTRNACSVGEGYNHSICSGGSTTGCSACDANTFDDGSHLCLPCTAHSNSSSASVGCTCASGYTAQGSGSGLSCTDKTPPVFSNCPSADIEYILAVVGGTVVGTFPAPTANDEIDGPVNVTLATTLGSGDNFPAGNTTVTYGTSDSSLNTVFCLFTVVVRLSDSTPPAISGCPGNIAHVNDDGRNGSIVTWGSITATDSSPPVTLTMSTSPTANLTSGSEFPQGVTTVSYVFTDAYTNSAICSFTVTITDANACATSNGGCSVHAVCTDFPPPAPGTPTSSGRNCTCLSGYIGDGLQCQDVDAPVFSNCPNASLTRIAGAHGVVIGPFSTPIATDAIDGPVTATQLSEFGAESNFSVGNTSVSYRAVDTSGNVNYCNFTVIVVLPDKEPPVITGCPYPPVVIGYYDESLTAAVVVWDDITASDASPPVQMNMTKDPPRLGSTFPLGVTTITYTFVDNYDNSASCIFNVSVIRRDACSAPNSTNGGCSLYATCTDLPPPAPNTPTADGRTCACCSGYSGNGVTCTLLVPSGGLGVTITLNGSLSAFGGANFISNFINALAADTGAPASQFSVVSTVQSTNGIQTVTVSFVINATLSSDSSVAVPVKTIVDSFQAALASPTSNLATYSPDASSVTIQQPKPAPEDDSSSGLSSTQTLVVVLIVFVLFVIVLLGLVYLVAIGKIGGVSSTLLKPSTTTSSARPMKSSGETGVPATASTLQSPISPEAIEMT